MSNPRKETNVTVLGRSEIDTYPKLGEKQTNTHITYVAAGLPPHTIIILTSKYSLIAEKAAIKKDIVARLKNRPEAYTV